MATMIVLGTSWFVAHAWANMLLPWEDTTWSVKLSIISALGMQEYLLKQMWVITLPRMRRILCSLLQWTNLLLRWFGLMRCWSLYTAALQTNVERPDCTAPLKTVWKNCSASLNLQSINGQLAMSDDEADFSHRIVLQSTFRNQRFRDTIFPSECLDFNSKAPTPSKICLHSFPIPWLSTS